MEHTVANRVAADLYSKSGEIDPDAVVSVRLGNRHLRKDVLRRFIMAEPKRTVNEIRGKEQRDCFQLEGFTDTQWEMVSVHWIDAESDGGSGWQDPEDMLEYARRPLPVMHTVGLLVYEDAEQVAITDTRPEDGLDPKIPRIWPKRLDRLGPIASKLEDSAPSPSVIHNPHIESRAG